MKSLLRSTFSARSEDDQELLLRNHQALVESGLVFDTAEDGVIWKFVQDFVRAHQHVPDIGSLRSHFGHLKEEEVINRIEILTAQPAKTRGDFLTRLNVLVDEQKVRKVTELLKDAGRIVQTGIEVNEGRGKKKRLKGPQDAVRYLMDAAHDIVAPTIGVRLSGDITTDGQSFMQEYDRVEADPLAGLGQFTGIRQIDTTIHGAKRGELWTHAAFTGGLKSTLAINWLYNQAVYYRHSSIMFSLEMPYNHVRRLFYALHSANDKFADMRAELGIDKWLHYVKIRDGRLDSYTDDELIAMPEEARRKLVNGRNPARPEYRFLKEVAEDFNNPKNEYGHIHIEVANPDKSDFTVLDLQSKAELIYAKDPAIAMIVADHAGLMAPRHRHNSTTENLNEVVRDLKRLSMGFNRGLGMAVVSLFQISREGFKSAEKSDGRYNLTHLSYSNECLVGGTLIVSDRGALRVDDLKVGDQVWSRAGWKPVLATFDQGVRPTWQLETCRGAQLESTGNHRLRVLRDEKIDWAHVSDLQPKDWVLGTMGGGWPTETPALPPLNDSRDSTTPTHLTEDLAYILGAWHGDAVERPYGVAFTGNREEVDVECRIATTFARVFGRAPNQHHYASRSGSFDMECFGKDLRDWFHSVAGDHHGAVVPDVILRAPRRYVLAFLKGLFDTDGWITNQNHIGLKMKSREFLAQIQQLLTLVGLDSTLKATETVLEKTGKSYTGWCLRLLGFESRVQFAREIGFTEAWKSDRLAKAVEKSPRRKASDQVYPVGHTYRTVCERHTPYGLITAGRIRKAHYNSQLKAKQTGLVSRGAIEYLLAYLDAEGIADAEAEYLRHLLTLHVVQVASVGPTGRDEQVYDIEVPGDHEYQSGPVLSHNCERSSDIITTTFVNDDLKQRGLTRFQCLKSRDDAPFPSFYSYVHWPCRLISTCNDVTVEDAHEAGSKMDIEKRDLLAD